MNQKNDIKRRWIKYSVIVFLIAFCVSLFVLEGQQISLIQGNSYYLSSVSVFLKTILYPIKSCIMFSIVVEVVCQIIFWIIDFIKPKEKKITQKFIRRKVIMISILILFVIIALILISLNSSNTSLSEVRESVTKIINKEYSSYEIKDLQLEYVDWYSTVRTADEYHSATRATAIIENEEEQITLHFKKNFFNIWSISSAEPNYGSSVPNDVYFVHMNYVSVGNKVDIDEHIKKYWVIPDGNENLYNKIGNDENWYYSFKECKEIYKTKDGYVYVFNKKISDWEKSTKTYADLCYYSNYTNVTKEYAIEIIEKYSSYREY